MNGGTDFTRYFSTYVVSQKKPFDSFGFAGSVTLSAAATQVFFYQNKPTSKRINI